MKKEKFLKELFIGISLGMVSLLFVINCDNNQEPILEDEKVKVLKVIDGDSLLVLKDGKEIEIRLKGIDAPEIGQAYGERAKQYVENVLNFKKEIRLELFDEYSYDRQIGKVYYHGFFGTERDLSEVLLSVGLAWHYIKYSNNLDYAEHEYYAKNQKKGVWSEPNPLAPWNFRK